MLTIGSRGPRVAALNEWLTTYGYYPNQSLAASHADWRPVVASAPLRNDEFDENTARAVAGLQQNAGLTPTGELDGKTQGLLTQARCGTPDMAANKGVRDKFARASRWPGSTVTWRLGAFPTTGETLRRVRGVTQAQALTAIRNSFAAWAGATQLTFTESTGAADIVIDFAPILQNGVPKTGGTYAQAFFPHDGGDITVDTAETWSVASTTPSGSVDLQGTLTHEIGHSIGLHHSSIGTDVTMYPFNPNVGWRTLHVDDTVGISSYYDSFQVLPGLAKDIGIGGTTGTGTVWIVGAAPAPGGFSIHRWNGSNWDLVSGGAVRIAVQSNGVPWIVNDAGVIFRRTSSTTTGSWTTMPGCAKDIGIGSNGSVWAVGCNATAGGFTIHSWNGSAWTNVDGGATRISVDNAGRPWVVNANGDVLRRSGSAWELLPGKARDIGVGSNGYAYAIGNDAQAGGFGVHLFNEQSAIGDDAPLVRDWVPLTNAGAVAVAAGPSGPWLVNDAGNIFRATR